MALIKNIPPVDTFEGYGYYFKNDDGNATKTAIALNTNYTAGNIGGVAFPDSPCNIVKVSGASGYTIIHNGVASWHNNTNPQPLVKGDFVLVGGGSTYLTFKFTS